MDNTTMGRPTIYKIDYNEQAYKLCLLGATDKDLADFFGVTEQTINNWKNDYPDFFVSIKRGKDIADANVADRLYQRATGYEHPEDQIFQFQGQPVIVPTKKHYAPDTAAAIFWLKNRQSAKWRDKVETEISGPNGGPIELTNVNSIPDADLKQLEDILSRSLPAPEE